MLSRALQQNFQMLGLQARHFAWRPTQIPNKTWDIVKDDFVQVTEGRFKQSRGKVMKVLRSTNQLVVQGVNLVS